MFKIGDRVRLLSTTHRAATKGSIGEVLSFLPSGSISVTFNGKDTGRSVVLLVTDKEIEHIPESPKVAFKIGDKVRTLNALYKVQENAIGEVTDLMDLDEVTVRFKVGKGHITHNIGRREIEKVESPKVAFCVGDVVQTRHRMGVYPAGRKATVLNLIKGGAVLDLRHHDSPEGTGSMGPAELYEKIELPKVKDRVLVINGKHIGYYGVVRFIRDDGLLAVCIDKADAEEYKTMCPPGFPLHNCDHHGNKRVKEGRGWWFEAGQLKVVKSYTPYNSSILLGKGKISEPIEVPPARRGEVSGEMADKITWELIMALPKGEYRDALTADLIERKTREVAKAAKESKRCMPDKGHDAVSYLQKRYPEIASVYTGILAVNFTLVKLKDGRSATVKLRQGETHNIELAILHAYLKALGK